MQSSYTMAPKTAWEVFKDFTAPSFDISKGGICVRVSVLHLRNPGPRYSMTFGWKYPNDEMKIHIQHDMEFDSAEASVLLDLAKKSIKEAIEVFEQARLQQEAIQKKREDEERLHKQEKKKKYENNKKIRAEENRQRASGGGGRKK